MRIKRAVNKNKRKTKVLKAAKGYRATRGRLYRSAISNVMRAQKFAYVGRKLRKRDMRALWIARINAACRLNEISYSQFMHGLNLASITLNRKSLAEMAVNDKAAFASLVELAKSKLNTKK